MNNEFQQWPCVQSISPIRKHGLYKCDFKKYFVPLCSKRVAGSVPRGFQNCIAFLLYVQESVHKQRIGLKGICWCTMVWKIFWRNIHVFIVPSVFMSSCTKIIEIISCSQDLIMSSKFLVYKFQWNCFTNVFSAITIHALE